MTTGAAQTLARAYQVAPGARVVVAGNGPLDFQLAADLVVLGVEVVAVLESARRPRPGDLTTLIRAFATNPAQMLAGAGYLLRLWSKRAPVLWSHVAVGAIAAIGGRGLEAVRIAPVAADGTPDLAAAQTLAADTLCLGYGLIASSEIANALGCRMELDPRHLGTLRVVTTATGETSVAGVFAVGDGAHVAGAAVAEAAGRIAGVAAAAQLGFGSRRYGRGQESAPAPAGGGVSAGALAPVRGATGVFGPCARRHHTLPLRAGSTWVASGGRSAPGRPASRCSSGARDWAWGAARVATARRWPRICSPG